jgi:MoxR-like ATPase
LELSDLHVVLLLLLLLQALTPQITENKRKTEELLREAYTLQQCLSQATAAGILEKLLPKRYKQYQKGVSGKV